MPRPRRHPAEVTSDRLGDALDKWPNDFDGQARDAVAFIRQILENIAERAGGE
ncbi:hypothetical protein [Nonomuraea sp. NPDC049784]|uniref:hypothetical protein n=1 Tax=Nonomuraea sp. NPDC049784 TaxID=3154361 RepID=UPI00340EF9AF